MRTLALTLILAVAVGATLVATDTQSPARPTSSRGLDLVLVLDNSGSMRQNDSQFLTRRVVAAFLASDQLPRDTRAGLVVFADNAELLLPLEPLADAATRNRITTSLAKLDYSGGRTDTPAGVERALYELKEHGRREAERSIVIMTDGIIATGDRVKDAERHRWLQTELVDECARLGVRIFGLAFTDAADYELIQTLSQKTGGEYFRVLTATEVSGTFDKIAAGVARPRPVPAVPASQAGPATLAPPPSTPPSSLLIGGPALAMGIIVVATIVVLLFWRDRRMPAAGELIPKNEQAFLLDLNDPPILPERRFELTFLRRLLHGLLRRQSDLSHLQFRLTRRVTKIGRVKGRKGDLCVNRKNVSVEHAEIHFRDGTYHLVDTDSLNGTSLDGGKPIPTRVQIPLKSGWEIFFAGHRFEFAAPGGVAHGTQPGVGGAGGRRRPSSGPSGRNTVPSGDDAGAPGEGGSDGASDGSSARKAGDYRWWTSDESDSGQRGDAASSPNEPTAFQEGNGRASTGPVGRTRVRPKSCSFHPESEPTEVCAACLGAFCAACMSDKDGRRVCARCLDAAVV